MTSSASYEQFFSLEKQKAVLGIHICLALFIMYATSYGWPSAFSSSSSPVYRLVALSCIPGFELSQVSCPGSSVGRALTYNAECHGFESHPG